MYVCMHVCMHVYMYVYTHIHTYRARAAPRPHPRLRLFPPTCRSWLCHRPHLPRRSGAAPRPASWSCRFVCVCVCVCVWCVPAHSTIRLNIQAMHGERNENHLLAPPRTRIAHSRTARPIVAMHWHLLARARRQRFPNGLDLCSDHAWCHCPYLSSPVNLPSFLLYLAALTLEFQ